MRSGLNKSALLKKVRRLEIKTRGLSQQLFSGEYHSAFKGRGMSFSEVREYQYGDDVRNIDWNVTARMEHPYVKVFEEERELTVMLLIDISRSSMYGTKVQTKNELVTEISAVLSFSAITNNDKVGVILFTDRIEKFIPPKKGKSHILRIISDLLETEPEGRGTDVAILLEYFSNVVKKRSIAFLFSDFIDSDFSKPLRIAARKHDLIGVRIFDHSEANLPDAGLIRMQDSEKGSIRWIDSSSPTVRKQYHKRYMERVQQFESDFARSGADTISIATDQPYLQSLHGFFRKRMNRK
jgi:uncharacterized protein (DUF58 family)